jgi:hypothetical protein
VGGVILVVLGLAFLIARVFRIELGVDAWPIWIVGPGLALLVAGLVVGGSGGLGLVIPGAIISTVGGVLWVQDATGLWSTWAYAWALVAPGSVGLGMVLYGITRGDRDLTVNGTRTLLTGLGLFFGFALFFEGAIGLSGGRIPMADVVLPLVAVGIGIALLVLSVVRRSDRPA